MLRLQAKLFSIDVPLPYCPIVVTLWHGATFNTGVLQRNNGWYLTVPGKWCVIKGMVHLTNNMAWTGAEYPYEPSKYVLEEIHAYFMHYKLSPWPVTLFFFVLLQLQCLDQVYRVMLVNKMPAISTGKFFSLGVTLCL